MVQQCHIAAHLGQLLDGDNELIETEAKPDSFDITPLKNVLGMELKDTLQATKEMVAAIGIWFIWFLKTAVSWNSIKS